MGVIFESFIVCLLLENDQKDLTEVQTQVAEKYMELYKVEEIPSYRHVAYKRKDPIVSQLDPRTDKGTFADKLEDYRIDPERKLKDIRSLLKNWKVKGRVRFVEWVPSPKVRILCLLIYVN